MKRLIQFVEFIAIILVVIGSHYYFTDNSVNLEDTGAPVVQQQKEPGSGVSPPIPYQELAGAPARKSFQFQMNGKWLPNVSNLHVGAENYTTLENLGYTDSGLETVDGYTLITSSSTSEVLNLHHFVKDGESHVMAKVYNASSIEYADLLLHFDGADESTTFTDSGQNIHTVTPSGDAQLDTADYKFATASGLFDGTGDFLTVPDHDCFYVGTSDFTIDFWIKLNTSSSGTYTVFDDGGSGATDYAICAVYLTGDPAVSHINFTVHESVNGLDTMSLEKYIYTAGYFQDWHHVAIDKNGTVLKMYIDGISVDTDDVTDSEPWNNSNGAGNFYIGATNASGTNAFNGWIDEFRFTNGESYYQNDFDPPSAEYETGSSEQYYLIENTTPIPDEGDFDTDSLYAVGEGTGSFANADQGTMLYVDSQTALIWGGDEMRIGQFYTSDSSDADEYDGFNTRDYTQNIDNDNRGSIAHVGNGADANTVTLLHFNGVDASTTITDSASGGSAPHTYTAYADAQLDTDDKHFGVSSLLLDGTGDYVYASDSDDWDFDSGDGCYDVWLKWVSGSQTNGVFQQYDDANNYIQLYTTANGSGVDYNFIVKSGGSTIVSLAGELANMYFPGGGGAGYFSWHHVAITKEGTTCRLFIGGTLKDVGTATGDFPNLAASLRVGSGGGYIGNGWVDEFRVVKGSYIWNSNFTVPTEEYSDFGRYVFIGSPLKLNGVKLYISTENTQTASVTASYWNGEWSNFGTTQSDGTNIGGVTLAQTGSITWPYMDDAEIRYLNGSSLYWYRLDFSGAYAEIYKATAVATLQPIQDVWNSSPRTCISFQLFRNASGHEDWTYMVEAQDSTTEAVYAAKAGGIGINSADHFFMAFDDRIMAVKFNLVSGHVNTNAIQINNIEYWNGEEYTSVGNFYDTTLDSAKDSTMNRSGVVSWTPPPSDSEHPRDVFGVEGYTYVISFTTGSNLTDGTDHDGTAIDQVTGITAPLSMDGYDIVSTYNNRVLLVDGNTIDFSQSGTPFVYNGVDSSDNGINSLHFGDSNSIVALESIYNRYGSNLIEGKVVFKPTETYLLTGSQPSANYSDQFSTKLVSGTIGCPAPMSIVSHQIEVTSGYYMGIVGWVDYAGPLYFNGAEPTRLHGIDNYFDPSYSECINHDYIDKTISYVDSVNGQWNIIMPTGTSTVLNTWVVYDFKHSKPGDERWFQVVPYNYYPEIVTEVTDAKGVKYNYAAMSDNYMYRLNDGFVWEDSDGSNGIDQQITTGIFSPPFLDPFGFWSYSRFRGARLMSYPTTEDQDATIKLYYDGTLSSTTITVPLDASGALSYNNVYHGNFNEEGKVFQLDYTATTSTEKWKPLAHGYEAVMIRKD